MAVILNCDKCNKRMGSLEPHIIAGDKYLCKPCGDTSKKSTSESEAINDFYEGLEIGDPSWLGFWKKQEYKLFVDSGFQFISIVPIISYPPSYADQFDNHKYIILAYNDHWCVYNGKGTKVCDAQPNTFNGFNAFSPIYISSVIKQFI